MRATHTVRATHTELLIQSYSYRATHTELLMQSYSYRATHAELLMQSYSYRATHAELLMQSNSVAFTITLSIDSLEYQHTGALLQYMYTSVYIYSKMTKLFYQQGKGEGEGGEQS